MERIVSYAQNGEDVVLNRVFRGQTGGFYIDVGANEPVTDSVTMLFYLRGWSGVNVEPALGVYDRLAAHRRRTETTRERSARDRQLHCQYLSKMRSISPLR